jgi:anaerobic magnesium-protoporphyrin IX monomethyl ester cyclase
MKMLFVRIGSPKISEFMPPLGILYLCSVLRREFQAECLVLDPLLEPISDADIVRRAARFNPDFIGLSSLSCQSQEFRRVARGLHGALPHVDIIAGGPYASSQAEEILHEGSTEVCVLGEGETTLPVLIRALQNETPLSDVRGIAFHEGKKFRLTEPAIPIEDLDALPYPAYDLTDIDFIERLASIGTLRKCNRYFTMFSSRGCPYRCSFCHHIFGKKFRARSARGVLAEIDLLRNEYGVREIQFSDDAFNLDRTRTIDICKGLIERGAPVALAFPNGLRSDLLDEEVVDCLARAGTYKVAIAVESASPRIQSEIGKNLNIARVSESMKSFARRRVIMNGFFILGFPGETIREMRETIRFACKSRLHAMMIFYAQPLPGNHLYQQYISERGTGLTGDDFRNYVDVKMTHYTLSPVASEKIVRTARLGWMRFYANPFRLIRIIRDMPRKSQLLGLASIIMARVFSPPLERLIGDKWRILLWKQTAKGRGASLSNDPGKADQITTSPGESA